MSYPNTYIVGTEMKLRATFSLDGTPTDPQTVSCSVKRPDGTIDTPVASKVVGQAGTWEASYTPDAAGVYVWRMAGIGGLVAANEDAFIAQTSF